MNSEALLPQISVLVPSYNHEQYVESCLRSLGNAYEGPLEIIICDDYSKDLTSKVIKKFINNYKKDTISFVFIKNSINKGVSATLNECLNNATSEYIYIIASDDHVVPNGLTVAMKLLLVSDSDAVISDCHVINGSDHKTYESAFFGYRKSSFKNLKSNLKSELVMNWVVPGPSLLLKKIVYNFVGNYNENLLAEDRDFYLRLVSTMKVIFNKQKIANYRVHDENFSKSKTYIENMEREFSKVNYNNADRFSGLSYYYLKTYKLDLMGFMKISRTIRKIIKLFRFFS